MMRTVLLMTLVACGIVPVNAAEKLSYAAWPRDCVFYHVYVRSFADSDGDGNGDLDGLTAKLDYVAALGVDGILLLPIFQSDLDIYGGYATTDYYHVEKDYGGDVAWDRFILAARKHKLKIILDLSLTHVAEAHPWFAAAKKDRDARERRHFIWAGPPCPGGKTVFGGPAWTPLGNGPCYYSSYGGMLPGLNIRDAATADELISVGNYWLRRGASGFRLDSAKHIGEIDPARPEAVDRSSPATHAFWRRFLATMKATDPESFAVAELMEGDASQLTAFYRDGIDMAFDYPVYYGLIDAWNHEKKKHLASLISSTLVARPSGALGGIFTGNHDVPGEFVAPYGRVADLLGGDKRRLESAALLLFSLPSTPFIYYGEEIGMRGIPRSGGKRWARNPMQWDKSPARGFTAGKPWLEVSTDPANVADQNGVPSSLLETYRRLIKTRRASPALRRGAYREVPSAEPVLAFLREHAEERVLVAINFSGREVAANLDLKALGVIQAATSDLVSGNRRPPVTPENAAGYRLALPPHQGQWLLLK